MNALRRVGLSLASLAVILLLGVPGASAQCVSLTTLGSASTQNFDTLSNTAGSTTNNLTITGWFLLETGTAARVNQQYAVDTGASNTGDVNSYGAAGDTDRALGSLRSGTLVPSYGACFTNNTGSTLTSLDVGYTGEEWRLGTVARTDQLTFEYSLNATSLSTGSWTGVAALNFVTPDTATAGAKNGNAAADRTVIAPVNVPALSIANGATFWIRWTDVDGSGADDGLAIDDFTLTPQGGPGLPNLTVNDVSLNEGNTATTSFTFTVNLSAPAGPGGVTFDIATADGTAQDDNPGTDDEDYAAKSLTSQTIPAGSSTYSFTVLVNGDTDPETNETFFVNVSNVTGGNVTDGQGQGTIVNDDAAPNLTVNDVTLNEGDAGTTSFIFTVNLSAPAGPGGVTFDIATADGTAQDDNPGTEDEDYTAKSLTGQTIPVGSSTYSFTVLVNGDTETEPNETFFVNVTNITNAIATDPQGLGTISNEDYTRIHDIQGNGSTSPLTGVVTTRGVVTGRKSNGYFIQEPDATVDADPATSEGIYVFTSSAPPAAAAVGNLVEVTGTIQEFVPTADLLQPPMTELVSPTTTQISTGNPLPAAIPLTATFPDPSGSSDQMERVEGMRVSVASLTVVAPTAGNSTAEANATQTSNGVFYGVVTGLPRPAREPGIQAPDPAPSGTIPPIPRFDANPELLRIDSDAIGGAIIDVSTTAVVTGIVGPVEYTFRHYTIHPDPSPAPVVTGGMTATAVSTPTSSEFTIGSYNLERFFDTVNDPSIGEPVLTTTAFNNRLNKASLGIRDHLKMPDILGVVEVENLSTLQALAAKINSDASLASQPDPQYVAYLQEGNDVGGIDVGFLVKTAIVSGSTPRVSVNSVTQVNPTELFVNADSSTEELNDRPSLVLDAVINGAGGSSFPVVVIVNHLRSLIGVNDESAGAFGWSTVGARVRAKRLKQAESLANYIQGRQTTNPAERIVLVGDFNAYEFNDGLVDMVNVIAGTPPPDDQTAVPGDGVDLVNPDLDDLVDTPPPGERYSYLFDGSTQNIDHVIVNQPFIAATNARRVEHARINADFPAIDRNNASTPRHLSDHDPVLGFFSSIIFTMADLSITKTDSPDPVSAGSNLTYTITLGNDGPDPASTASWTDTLPAGTTFVSLSSAAGWTCTTPAVGAGGTVSCSNATFPVGSAPFTLTVAVDPSLTSGTVLSNTATVTSSTSDGAPGNESATATTTVAASADLSISKSDSPDPVFAGGTISYTISVTNAGPSNAASVTLTDTLPAGTTRGALSLPAGWSCSGLEFGETGTLTCTTASMGATTANFTLDVVVDPSVAAGTVLSNTATASTTTTDANGGNNSATATTTVAAQADLQVTKTDSPDPIAPGSNLTYTITVANAGPSNASLVAVTDIVPASTTFVSLSAPAGWSCTTPAVGSAGAINCTMGSMPLGNAVFTLVVAVDSAATNGTVLTNTATATHSTADPNGSDNSATTTTTVTVITSALSITKTDSADPVMAGSNLTYTITSTNAGPDAAGSATVSDTLPANTTFVSLASPAGWTCTTPAVGATGTVNCSNASMAVGSAVFSLTVAVSPTAGGGTVLSNTATISSSSADGNPADNSVTENTAVTSPATLSATKSASGSFAPGTVITYTIVISNAGPAAQGNNPGDEMTDVLPASLTLLAATASSGTAVANTGTNTVTWNGALAAGSSVTITIQALIESNVTPGTTITNQATINYDADGNGTNEATATSDDPSQAGGGQATGFVVVAAPAETADIPALDGIGLAALAALLAGIGLLVARRA